MSSSRLRVVRSGQIGIDIGFGVWRGVGRLERVVGEGVRWTGYVVVPGLVCVYRGLLVFLTG